MTVSAWIESLQRFDAALPVIIRVQGEDVLLIAESPSFSVDSGCTETEALCVDMAHEDEGVDEVLALGPADHSDTRNSRILSEFIAYCQAHPYERFWQALRNWSRFRFIIGSDAEPSTWAGSVIDTFNFEGKDA